MAKFALLAVCVLISIAIGLLAGGGGYVWAGVVLGDAIALGFIWNGLPD